MDSNLANMSSVPSTWPPIKLDIFGSAIENWMWAKHSKPSFSHLVDHRTQAAAQSRKLPQRLFENGGERQKTEGVPGRGGVEDDHRVFHRLDVPRNFAD